MPSYKRDLAMFQDRRFALLFVARTISMLGAAFAPVALAFGVLAIPGATPRTLSVVLAAEAIPMVLFMLVGGVIADRFPRNRVMMFGEVFNAVAWGSLAVMLLTGWTPLPVMAFAAALSGIAVALLYPALTGIIPEVVPADRLQTANALLGLGANSARVAGLVLSGITVAVIGGGWALVVSALMFAFSATLVAAMRLKPVERAAGAGKSVLKDLRDGWDEFRSRQWLWVVVAQFSVLVMAVQAAHGVLGPVIAKESLGGPAAWSAVLTAEAVGMIVGVLVALRLRPRRPILVCTLLTPITAFPYLLIGFGAPLWLIIIGAFLMGISFDVFGVLWNTTMQREVPAESLSRVSSYDALGSLMFGPIGLLLAGPVAVAFGAQTGMIACAVIVILTAGVALLSPEVRNLTAKSPEPAEALV